MSIYHHPQNSIDSLYFDDGKEECPICGEFDCGFRSEIANDENKICRELYKTDIYKVVQLCNNMLLDFDLGI